MQAYIDKEDRLQNRQHKNNSMLLYLNVIGECVGTLFKLAQGLQLYKVRKYIKFGGRYEYSKNEI